MSTPINVMLSEAKEVPLKLRFNYLIHKFLIKNFARSFDPVTYSLDSLKLVLLSSHWTNRVRLLRAFPLFKRFISIQSICATIYSFAFLPAFFFDFETAIFATLPCMDMFPVDKVLSSAAINKKFLELSSPYRQCCFFLYGWL